MAHSVSYCGAAACPLLDNSGKHLLFQRISHFDPTATLAVHCDIALMLVSAPINGPV
jgi:hypothetical protein